MAQVLPTCGAILLLPPSTSVYLSGEWVFCGLGCSFGAAGMGDLRVTLEPGRWTDGLLTGTRGLIFCERETADFQGSRKD